MDFGIILDMHVVPTEALDNFLMIKSVAEAGVDQTYMYKPYHSSANKIE